MIEEKSLFDQEKDRLLARADHAEAYLAIGRYHHVQVDYPAAIRAYSLGLLLDPASDRLHCMLALTYHNLGNHGKALAHYRKATQLNPRNAEANYYLGFILVQEGEADDAIACLKKAIALQPNLSPAYHYLGIALERTGEHGLALETLRQYFVKSYPSLASDVVFTIGELLSGRRRYASAGCHARACLDVLLKVLDRKHLHCFGDSHRSVFNGLDGVKCYNVGAATAYNLISTSSSTGAGSKILKVVDQLDRRVDALLLVFGEIDCMEHIFKNVFRGSAHSGQITKRLVNRFVEFAGLLADRGFEVLIYGPAFSGVALNSHGSLRARNRIVRLFNHHLRIACASHPRLSFASLDHLLIDGDFEPRLHFSNDGRHLDYFPKGSKVIQGIIFSAFASSVLERKPSYQEVEQLDSDATVDAGGVAEGKPFIIVREAPSHDSSGGRVVDWLQSGLLANDSVLPLRVSPCRESGFVVDLLDHLSINVIRFVLLGTDSDCKISGDLEAIGIGKDGHKMLAHQALAGAGQLPVELHCQAAFIARAVWIRVRWDCERGNGVSGLIRIGGFSVGLS